MKGAIKSHTVKVFKRMFVQSVKNAMTQVDEMVDSIKKKLHTGCTQLVDVMAQMYSTCWQENVSLTTAQSNAISLLLPDLIAVPCGLENLMLFIHTGMSYTQ